eukprot:s292_g1.t1
MLNPRGVSSQSPTQLFCAVICMAKNLDGHGPTAPVVVCSKSPNQRAKMDLDGTREHAFSLNMTNHNNRSASLVGGP